MQIILIVVLVILIVLIIPFDGLCSHCRVLTKLVASLASMESTGMANGDGKTAADEAEKRRAHLDSMRPVLLINRPNFNSTNSQPTGVLVCIIYSYTFAITLTVSHCD